MLFLVSIEARFCLASASVLSVKLLCADYVRIIGGAPNRLVPFVVDDYRRIGGSSYIYNSRRPHIIAPPPPSHHRHHSRRRLCAARNRHASQQLNGSRTQHRRDMLHCDTFCKCVARGVVDAFCLVRTDQQQRTADSSCSVSSIVI